MTWEPAMAERDAVLMSSAAEWIGAYSRASLTDIDPRLLGVQARRATLIVERLTAGESLVLPDPVGTGKTAVALVAAAMMLERGAVRRVVVVAPNDTVRSQWAERARWLVSPRTGRPAAHRDIQVVTRRGLARERRPVRPDGVLVVVDEAHRGLQTDGEFQERLAKWAMGCHVLLVTATPFLLSTQGLTTMLGIGASDDRGRHAIEAYGQVLGDLAAAHRRAVTRSVPNPAADPRVLAAVQVVLDARGPAVAALDRRILKQDTELLRLRGEPPPLQRHLVDPTAAWHLAYHVARVVPELLAAGKGDMFNRRLVSSSEAFASGAAGKSLEAREQPHVVDLRRELLARLGSGAEHPKVAETAQWAAARVRRGRNVVVFCVFAETRDAVASALRRLLGSNAGVTAPTGATIDRAATDRFRCADRTPEVLVLQDRFSESIDLDGGRPCVVHHDLPWTPGRVMQRWGRVVRARSGFTAVEPQDIFVPVLDVEIDRRMFDTVQARARIGDLLLPRQVQVDLEDPDEFSLPDAILDQFRVRPATGG